MTKQPCLVQYRSFSDSHQLVRMPLLPLAACFFLQGLLSGQSFVLNVQQSTSVQVRERACCKGAAVFHCAALWVRIFVTYAHAYAHTPARAHAHARAHTHTHAVLTLFATRSCEHAPSDPHWVVPFRSCSFSGPERSGAG